MQTVPTGLAQILPGPSTPLTTATNSSTATGIAKASPSSALSPDLFADLVFGDSGSALVLPESPKCAVCEAVPALANPLPPQHPIAPEVTSREPVGQHPLFTTPSINAAPDPGTDLPVITSAAAQVIRYATSEDRLSLQTPTTDRSASLARQVESSVATTPRLSEPIAEEESNKAAGGIVVDVTPTARPGRPIVAPSSDRAVINPSRVPESGVPPETTTGFEKPSAPSDAPLRPDPHGDRQQPVSLFDAPPPPPVVVVQQPIIQPVADGQPVPQLTATAVPRDELRAPVSDQLQESRSRSGSSRIPWTTQPRAASSPVPVASGRPHLDSDLARLKPAQAAPAQAVAIDKSPRPQAISSTPVQSRPIVEPAANGKLKPTAAPGKDVRNIIPESVTPRLSDTQTERPVASPADAPETTPTQVNPRPARPGVVDDNPVVLERAPLRHQSAPETTVSQPTRNVSPQAKAGMPETVHVSATNEPADQSRRLSPEPKPTRHNAVSTRDSGRTEPLPAPATSQDRPPVQPQVPTSPASREVVSQPQTETQRRALLSVPTDSEPRPTRPATVVPLQPTALRRPVQEPTGPAERQPIPTRHQAPATMQSEAPVANTVVAPGKAQAPAERPIIATTERRIVPAATPIFPPVEVSATAERPAAVVASAVASSESVAVTGRPTIGRPQSSTRRPASEVRNPGPFGDPPVRTEGDLSVRPAEEPNSVVSQSADLVTPDDDVIRRAPRQIPRVADVAMPVGAVGVAATAIVTEPVDDPISTEPTEPLQTPELTRATGASVPLQHSRLDPAKMPDGVQKIAFESLVDDAHEAILSRAKILRVNESTEIEIEIDPPELGRLNIRVTRTETEFTARITVVEHSTFELLQSELHGLREALSQSSMSFGSVDIEQQGHRHQQQDSGSNKQSGRPLLDEESDRPQADRTHREDSSQSIDIRV